MSSHAAPAKKPHAPFGNQVPFCEPAWYQNQHSPYYNAGHVAFRAKCRAFVEKEIKPNAEVHWQYSTP